MFASCIEVVHGVGCTVFDLKDREECRETLTANQQHKHSTRLSFIFRTCYVSTDFYWIMDKIYMIGGYGGIDKR